MNTTLAPTRSNLLKLSEDLKFAQLGYELLDQKRSILVVELLTLVDQAVDYEVGWFMHLMKPRAHSVMQSCRWVDSG